MGFKLKNLVKIAIGVALVVGTGGAAAGLVGLSTAAGGAIAAGLGISGLAASAIGLVGGLVGTALITSGLTSKSSTFGADQSVQDALGTRQLTGANTANKLPWVVGGDDSGTFISGLITDVVWSTDNQTAWYVLALSEVATNQSFTFDTQNIYWSDKKVTFDSTDLTKVISLTDNAGNVDTKIANELYMYLYANGATSAGQNTTMTAQQVMQDSAIPSANRWLSTNTMSNTCFAIVKIIYNSTDGTTGLQPPTFRLKSNYYRAGDIWYEYMTNKVFGCGFDPSIVDSASKTALNTYGDELITYTTSSGQTSTQARYRLNGVIDTKQTLRQNLDNIMTACDCWSRWDEVNGLWKATINQAQNSVASFNDDNIIDNIQFSPKLMGDTYTAVEVSFPDGLIRDQQNNAYIEVPPNLRNRGQPDNQLNLSLLYVNDNVRAQYLANRILEQNQEDLIITFNAPFFAIGLEAGDVIDISNSSFAWSGKLFRVSQVTEIMDDAKGLYARISCFEYNAQVYDNFNITQFTPAPNTGIPDPSFFGTLVAPTVTNPMPNIGIPSFTLNGTVPASGICNQLDFYVSTTNSSNNATLLVSAPNANGAIYPPNSLVSREITGLNTGVYYFFTQAKNAIGTSAFSTPSASFTWNPTPSASVSGAAINFEWSPVVGIVSADANNTPLNLPQTYTLTLYVGTMLITPTNATTDPLMPNNSWRISNMATTGTIIYTGPTLVTNGFAYDVTALSTASATLLPTIRYKDSTGTVTQYQGSLFSITRVTQGAQGGSGYLTNGLLIFNQNSDGSFNTTTQNVVANFTYGGTTSTYTQPVTLNSNGFITYGTPSGSTGITVSTTGSGTRSGTISFTQTSSGIVLTATVLSQLLDAVTQTYIVYQQALSKPTTPSGGSIDTATGTLTPPVGWSISPTFTNTEITYQSQVTLQYNVNTGIVNITATWSSVQESSQTFSNGSSYVWALSGSQYIPNRNTVTVFQRSTTGVAPSTPIGGNYEWSTGTLIPPSGWFITAPTGTYDPLYQSTANITSTRFNTTSTIVWNTPTFIAQPVGKIANTKITRAGTKPVIVPIPTATELNTVYGRQVASFGDAVVIQYTDLAVSFTYDGTNWNQAQTYISGDAVVDGTITARTIAAQTITGDKIAANTITANRLNVNNLSAITANLGTITAGSITSSGSLNVGTSPTISSTTMTGSGAIINPTGTGTFALGNSTTNITFDGNQITMNGQWVRGGNVFIDGATIINTNNTLEVGTINTGQVVSGVGSVTYSANLTNTFNPATQGGGSATNLFQWSSIPVPTGTQNCTVTIPFSITATTVSGTLTFFNGLGGGSWVQQSDAINIPANTTTNGTASFIFSRFSGATDPTSLLIQTVISPASSNFSNIRLNGTCTIVFNGVSNPSPRTKILVFPPAFNTYP